MNDGSRENDLVLKPNEYCFLLDKTKGVVQCLTGSLKLSMSMSDTLVRYSKEENRFIEVTNPRDAIKPFVTAPENYYVVLLNPVKSNSHDHPRVNTANITPELDIGKKVIINGNCHFALYPGQMAKIIKGHTLRSNQYLIVKVYDADELKDSKYYNGQHIIIKGTDQSFFMPETGMEVIPDANGNYVRDAVTLSDLEYSVLHSESGERRFVVGPDVVFPDVDEEFAVNPDNNSFIFKAIELSDISGIYVKVIADYKEDDRLYKSGEELFITGKDSLIYYPRPEHAIISYEGKILHHAIAIPAGEGRYVLNRLTGEVKMIKGPRMYLPDPRTEVIVKRKLTQKECELWYPGNEEVKKYNLGDDYVMSTPRGMAIIDSLNSIGNNSITFTPSNYTISSTINADMLNNGFIGQDKAITDDKSKFVRGNTYSKPRTITIDNKFDGVVTIDVWTGYAINVVNKNGDRKVIVGPKTYLLEYDETLEVIHTPDGDDTVFLRVDNDRINSFTQVQTADFVDIGVEVCYIINFDPDAKDNWFNIENYKNYLCDFENAIIRREAKKHTLEEFYNNAVDIILECLDYEAYFENGMRLLGCEVGEVKILNKQFSDMLDKHQANIVAKSLELSAANKEFAVATQLEEIRRKRLELECQKALQEIEVKNRTEAEKIARQSEIRRMEEAEAKAGEEAKKEIQSILDSIQKSTLARRKAESEQEIAYQKERDKLEVDKQKSYTDAIKKVLESITPGLIEAINSSSRADMLKSVAESLAPYALADGNESVADVVDKLLRGTGMDGIINVFSDSDKN